MKLDELNKKLANITETDGQHYVLTLGSDNLFHAYKQLNNELITKSEVFSVQPDGGMIGQITSSISIEAGKLIVNFVREHNDQPVIGKEC